MRRDEGLGHPRSSGVGSPGRKLPRPRRVRLRVAAALPLLAAATTVTPASAQGPTPAAEAFRSLVEAERAFARDAGDGVSDAFVRALAADGVVFGPGPVNGRERHARRPIPDGVVLAWHPRVAGVSLAGDLGYTSGPYVARSAPDAEEAGYGHYFSIWRRAGPGEGWRLALDVGTPHERLEDHGEVPPRVPVFPSPAGREPFADAAAAERALRAASDALYEALDAGVPAAELGRFVLDGVRAYRTGLVPGVGEATLARRLGPEDRAPSRREVLDLGIARSLDLAWVLRAYRVEGPDAGGERGNLLELWVAGEGGWRLAVGLRHVHPSPG